jgi:Lrp/AsnC family transcriptional regulator for asnA, asnC and gidA
MVRISNLELIKLLKENSRASFVELAKSFDVSETAVRKRVKNLEEKGVIRKYTIDVDPKKIGFDVDALIGIDTRPEKYIQVMENLKPMKEVMMLCSSSGDHMLMIECWFQDSREFTKFIKVLEKMEGVIKVCPAMINEKMKC